MGKVNTAVCKEYLAQHFLHHEYLHNPRDWKRVSKHGNPTAGFVREFRNKQDDQIRCFIKSSEDEITEMRTVITHLNVLNIDMISSEEKRANVIEVLKHIVQGIIDRGDKFYLYHLPYEMPFRKLPTVKVEDYSQPGTFEDEELDFENCEIVEVTPDYIEIAAGGDWQEPLTFKCRWNGAEFECYDIREGFPEGISDVAFLRIIGVNSNG